MSSNHSKPLACSSWPLSPCCTGSLISVLHRVHSEFYPLSGSRYDSSAGITLANKGCLCQRFLIVVSSWSLIVFHNFPWTIHGESVFPSEHDGSGPVTIRGCPGTLLCIFLSGCVAALIQNNYSPPVRLIRLQRLSWPHRLWDCPSNLLHRGNLRNWT